MTDKTRITIAALITMLLLGAMSVAGALTHTGTHVVAHEQSAVGRNLGAACGPAADDRSDKQ